MYLAKLYKDINYLDNMKKILLFTSILFFAFSLSTIKAQTLDSVVTTVPIVCHGDLATITAYMTQTTPGTPVKLMNFKYVTPTFLVSNGSSSVTTNTAMNFTGINPSCYRMLMVDSILFYTQFPTGVPPQNQLQNPTDPSIIEWIDYCVDGVPQLSVTTTHTAINLCNGDCDAAEKLAILGGTPPYSITINGITSVLGIGSIDTTYLNLCADTYDATIVDVNGCVSNPGVTSFTIAEPPLLIPNGSISSNYNGQDISCFGEDDGEITGSVTGGTLPYTYSLDGITYGSSAIFSGLLAGTYTVYYKDNNGCDTSETFILTDPLDLSGALTITLQVSCNGAADGEIQFIVNNINTGTPGYQYSIDNGANFQNSNTFSGLLGGIPAIQYTIIVKDANGCESFASISLSEPTEIVFSVSSSDFNGFGVSCNGATDGQITIQSPTGGTPNYDYSIDGGNNYSSTMIHNGLGAGTYLVMVRDDNGCIKDTTIIITEPLPFTINASTSLSYNNSDVSCYGECDGEVIVTQLNGNPQGSITYTMTSHPSQTSSSWIGVCGGLNFGAYTINATDANGCTANTTITLTEPNPWAYTVDSMPETCNSANGQASIIVTQGGTGTLAYLWDDPTAQITATATNLVTGMYEVRVTDINGCIFTEDVFVAEFDITLSFDSVPPCNNLNNGSATVNPDGTPPYSILWETGESTNTITGLAPGFYSVTVSDATGCVIIDSVEVPTSAIVDIMLDVVFMQDTSVTCFGYASSGVTVIATGGTGSNTYLYNIPNFFPIPQASNTFSGLYAGVYSIFVTDFNGCSDSVEVTITEPNQLTFTILLEDVSCNGGADGIAWIDTIYGGTQPYSYSWSTGAIIDSISNLIAGTYIVQVTDANGCVSDPTSETITIIEPPILQSAITIVSPATCDSSQTLATGEMIVAASGGSPGYTYAWTSLNGFTLASSDNIIWLMPGMYTVDITDDNGCTISDSAEILPGENPTVAVVIQNVSCFGANDGLMTTSAIGGTAPYQFSDDGGTTFQGASTFGPSGPANYFITVVDSLGCTDTASVSVIEPGLLQVTLVNIQNINCYDSANGELEAIVIGGTPGYLYTWTDAATNIVAATQTATNLIPGNYSVSVTDTNNCPPATFLSVPITQPDSLYIFDLTFTAVVCNGDSTGTATVVAAGGTPNYSYAWSLGSSTDVALNLIAGNYTIQISDINGCSRNASVVVTEPGALSTTYIKDSVACIGGNDGWATVVVSGGVAPYDYLWDNGDITLLADTLAEGYHTVTITDNNLCVLIDSVNILEPSFSVTIDSLIISEITCHDADNASITVLATGGHLPYAYSNTNGFNTQSAIGFSNLGPNTYTMYVEDNYGCIDRDTVEIVNPDSLYIDTTIFSNVSCYGMNNGYIQAISAFGGTAPYEYSVNGGAHHANMAYFNGYGPGTYTVEVFDVNNCGAQDIIIITQPTELDVTITTSNWNSYQIQCNGDNSGTATIAVTGGQSPYTYTVLDINGDTVVSSTNSNISGLTAGTYTFVIEDANGCTYTETIIYNEPPPIVHNFIATHVSCSGWNNGSLTDVVSGGVGTATTYSYSWNTGATTYSLTSIPVGIYTMTVVDENNCTSIDSHTINDANALTATVAGTDVSCYDFCDGIIVTNVTGGLPNINSSGLPVYSYQWDDILLQNTANAIGLCVDNTSNSTTYSCVVTDGQGCTATVSYTLTQADSLHVTASISNEISCNLDNDGKLTATATGGTPGYNYLWNNWTAWSTNSTNNTLSVGSYVVVVKDSHGCMDTTEIYLSEPSALSIAISNEIDVSCFGFDDGTITADADGGTPINGIPPKYDYTWSNGFNEEIDISTVTGLATGATYTVTATDDNGCTITSQSVYITGPANPLSILVDSTDETCALNDGSATAFVLGGTLPYAYTWNNGGTANPQVNLALGLYTVDVTDANGCTISDETFVNGVQNIFLPGNLSSIDSTVCLGDSVFLEIEEKPNLNYVWEDGSTIVDRWVTPKDPVNVYTLSITDPNCANAYTVTATINVTSVDPFPNTNPAPVNGPYATIVKGESIEIFSDNMNCDIYEWSWIDDTVGTRVITDYPDASGWYYIAVDSDGCLGFDSIYVVVGTRPYDAITPNGDGFNDVWNIVDIASYPNAIIQVFNRWGSLVHETSGGLDYIAWDGTKDGKELPVGTYYYIIDLKTNDEPQSGPITIIR